MGRAGALQRLQARWEEASRNEGGLVVCTGEPGIGKTRLAARFAAAVHGDGAVVLFGRNDEESVTPYQPFVEALRHYAANRPDLTTRRGSRRRSARRWQAWYRSSARPARPAASRTGTSTNGHGTSSSRRWSGCCCTPRTGIACCSCSRICIGPMSPRCCCCARCCAAATGSPLLVIATLQRRGRGCERPDGAPARGPAARGGPGQVPLGGLADRRRLSSCRSAVGRDRRDGAAVKRLCEPDRRQPVLHRGAAARVAPRTPPPACRRRPSRR